MEQCLAQGMSLGAIGKLAGRHPSTVSYWLRKHGLRAKGHARHAPKGAINPDELRRLVEDGASIAEIARRLGAGRSTIRYWIDRLNLQTERAIRRREAEAAKKSGLRRAYLRCPKHGHTAFFSRPEGGHRCARCNVEAVSERRRQVKKQLVQEAGGECAICGFAQHPAALHFHHRDPSEKQYHLSFQGMTRSIERMREEAQKCILLCANCHALVEIGVAKIPDPGR